MALYSKARRDVHQDIVYLCDIVNCEEDAHAQNVNTGRLLCHDHYSSLGEVAQQRNWVLIQQETTRKRARKGPGRPRSADVECAYCGKPLTPKMLKEKCPVRKRNGKHRRYLLPWDYPNHRKPGRPRKK